MGYVFDGVIILLVALICFRAAKKGFILSALEFVSSFLGTAAAWVTANALCETVYVGYVKDRLIRYIDTKWISHITQSASSDVNALIAQIPDSVLSLGKQLKIIGDDPTVDFSGILSASQLEASFMGPVVLFIVKCLIFVVCAVLFGIILRFLAKVINKAVKASPLKSVNALLGGVFGLLKGFLVLFIVALVFRCIASVMPDVQIISSLSDSKICGLAVEILNLI